MKVRNHYQSVTPEADRATTPPRNVRREINNLAPLEPLHPRSYTGRLHNSGYEVFRKVYGMFRRVFTLANPR